MLTPHLFIFIMAVSLASINVNGVAEHHKRVKVFEALCSLRIDIFVLQETHLADLSQGKTWEKEWGGQAVWSPGSNRSAGVAVLIHPNSSVTLSDHNTDLAGRVLAVKLCKDNVSFQLLNVYAPNSHGNREHFFSDLWRFVYPNLETIVVGDFNCVPDIRSDKFGGDDSFGDRAVATLHTFTDSFNLEDFYRVSFPSGRSYTLV